MECAFTDQGPRAPETKIHGSDRLVLYASLPSKKAAGSGCLSEALESKMIPNLSGLSNTVRRFTTLRIDNDEEDTEVLGAERRVQPGRAVRMTKPYYPPPRRQRPKDMYGISLWGPVYMDPFRKQRRGEANRIDVQSSLLPDKVRGVALIDVPSRPEFDMWYENCATASLRVFRPVAICNMFDSDLSIPRPGRAPIHMIDIPNDCHPRKEVVGVMCNIHGRSRPFVTVPGPERTHELLSICAMKHDEALMGADIRTPWWVGGFDGLEALLRNGRVPFEICMITTSDRPYKGTWWDVLPNQEWRALTEEYGGGAWAMVKATYQRVATAVNNETNRILRRSGHMQMGIILHHRLRRWKDESTGKIHATIERTPMRYGVVLGGNTSETSEILYTKDGGLSYTKIPAPDPFWWERPIQEARMVPDSIKKYLSEKMGARGTEWTKEYRNRLLFTLEDQIERFWYEHNHPEEGHRVRVPLETLYHPDCPETRPILENLLKLLQTINLAPEHAFRHFMTKLEVVGGRPVYFDKHHKVEGDSWETLTTADQIAMFEEHTLQKLEAAYKKVSWEKWKDRYDEYVAGSWHRNRNRRIERNERLDEMREAGKPDVPPNEHVTTFEEEAREDDNDDWVEGDGDGWEGGEEGEEGEEGEAARLDSDELAEANAFAAFMAAGGVPQMGSGVSSGEDEWGQ